MTPLKAIFAFVFLWTVCVPVNSQTTPSSATIGCIKKNTGGEDYVGQASTTASGKQCISWANAQGCTQGLADKNITVSNNFCRNPSLPVECHRERPWCYTAWWSWEYCDVPICDDPYSSCMNALGLGSGAISDSQITATSYYSDLYLPQLARININTSGYWIPGNSANLQYLQINLLNPFQITKLYIQGSDYQYVQTFNILYSLDGFVWKAYSETADETPMLFNGNHGSDVAPVYFKNPFTAVYVVFVPRAYSWLPGVRLELFGCLNPATVPQTTAISQENLPELLPAASSPFVVRQMITLPYGTTLTIESGVKVIFIGGSSGFSFAGCLRSNGVKGLEVQMLSNNPLSLLNYYDQNGNPFWQGLSIASTSTSDCLSEVRNIVIVGANKGIALGTTSYTFNNLITRNCVSGVATSASVTCIGCLFDHNSVGIGVTTAANINLTVSSCTFRQHDYAIKITSNYQNIDQMNLNVIDSKFQQNVRGINPDYYSLYYTRNTKIYFSGNAFEMHQDYAIIVYSYYSDGQNMLNFEVDQTIFVASRVLIQAPISYNFALTNSAFLHFPSQWDSALLLRGFSKNLLISNCTFSNLSITGIQAYSIVPMAMIFRENRFSLNSGTSCIDINPDVSSSYSVGSFVLTENQFINNSVSYVLRVNDQSYSNITVSENIFDNPQSTYDIYMTSSSSPDYALNAGNNWWGDSNRSFVISRIYDFFSDFQRANVAIPTIYSDSKLIKTIDTRAWRDWNSTDATKGGTLRQNEALIFDSTSSSPLNVTGSIFVPQGLTLEIRGSVNISFAAKVGIAVRGTLILRGGSEGLLLLKPLNGDSWGGIVFVNSFGSYMSRAYLLNMETGVKLFNTSWNASDSTLDTNAGIYGNNNVPVTLSIDNTSINCRVGLAVNYFTGSNCTIVLTQSTLVTPGGTGLSLQPIGSGIPLFFVQAENNTFSAFEDAVYAYTSGPVSMNFHQNDVRGRIYVKGEPAILTAVGNTFSSSKAIYIDSTSNCMRITIQRNVFRCNTNSITLLSGYYRLVSCDNIRIEENLITQAGIYLYLTVPNSVRISQNNFTQIFNSIALSLQIWYYQGYYQLTSNDNDAIRLTNNTFTSNSFSTAVTLSCSSYPASIGMSENTFIDNSVTDVVYSNCPGLYVTENVFNNPKSTYQYHTTLAYNSDLTLYATGNFWNASSYSDITLEIFDHSDDASLASVEFSPWFNDVDMTILGRADSGFFRGTGFVIGGTLSDTVTLRNQGQPYIVDKDIVIPFGKTLTIEDGVQLIFRQGGITAEGTLQARGTESNWITMESEDNNTYWKGINLAQPYSDEVRRHSTDWWEIKYQSQWKVLESWSWNPDDMRQSADVLCKQAGYPGVDEVSAYDCSGVTSPAPQTNNSTTSAPVNPEEASLNLACNDLQRRVSFWCGQDKLSVKSVLDCNVRGGHEYNTPLVRISCLLPAPTASDTIYTIENRLGGYLAYSTEKDLGLVETSSDKLSTLLRVTIPCLLAGQSQDCVSIMSLGKPGWFLGHLNIDDVVMEPATNPSSPSTFKQDASFLIRQDRFVSGWIGLESVNFPGNFLTVKTENGSKRIALSRLNSTDFSTDAASFRLNLASKRKKRDTSGNQEHSGNDLKSQLQFVRITKASTGISIQGMPPDLDHVIVDKSQNIGIAYNAGYASGNFSMTNCTVSQSGSHGIMLAPSGGTFLFNMYIEGCNISSNGGRGVYMRDYSNITISNANVENNNIGLWIEQIYGSYGYNITAKVNQTRMIGNNELAVYCGGNQLKCHLYDNTIQFTKGFWSSNVLQIDNCFAVVANNIIENNTGGSRIVLSRAQSLEFFGNILRNNDATLLLYTDGGSYANITRNSFTNNSYRSDSVTLWIGGNDATKAIIIISNIFSNPLAIYEVYVTFSRRTDGAFLDLSRNIWNRGNYSSIIQSIYCFFNDMQRIPVNIWPFFLESTSTTPVLFPLNQSYFFENGIGGEIASSVTIPTLNGTYLVERSIFVEEGATLVIEEGVVLMFRQGRGLVVRGNLILEGTADSPIRFTTASDVTWPWAYWDSVLINIPPFSNVTSESVNLTHLIIEYNQNGVLIQAPVIHLSDFILKSIRSYGITLQGSNITVDNSTFLTTNGNIESGLIIQRWNIFDAAYSNAIIQNSTFISNDVGLMSSRDFFTVNIMNCTFMDNSQGIVFTNPSVAFANLTIVNSTFISNNMAVAGDLPNGLNFIFLGNTISGYYRSSCCDYGASGVYFVNVDSSRVVIQNNYFGNLSYSAVNLQKSYYTDLANITIEVNTFTNISKTAFQMSNAKQTRTVIRNNTFTLNGFQTDASVLKIQMTDYDWRDYRVMNSSFTQNVITQNWGKYIASFVSASFQKADESRYPFFHLSSNVFLDNSVTDSLIYTEYNRLNINRNVFSNLQSPYLVKVGFTSSFSENCSYNWWGSADAKTIASKIYDGNDDSGLGIVIYEPLLNSSDFICDTVNDCSGKGICVFPEVCQCNRGWQGVDCSQPSCAQVRNCLGRGDCIGPNTCRCYEGWFNSDCSGTTCYDRNNCSGRGICVAPNQCLCPERYGGANCSECGQYRWGPNCDPCPNCVHGFCNQNSGKCDCDSPNWTGDLCSSCAPRFFGPSCLPLIVVNLISPQAGPDVGNTTVHFVGVNFPNATTYRCRFDRTVVVPGIWLSYGDVSCLSPQHAAGEVTVELSVTIDQGYLPFQFIFIYYPRCPESACGSQLSPPHGICSMGSCICNVPWIGDDCSIQGQKPSIVPVDTQTLLEGQPFELTLSLSQGSQPVSWKLIDSPNGILLRTSIATLQWSKAVAQFQPYLVIVSCVNAIGSDQMTFNLSVPPSYAALLNPIPKGPLSLPQTIIIGGRLVWKTSNTYLENQMQPVNIIIQSSSSTRIIPVTTSYGTDLFYTRYYSSEYESGLFQVDARHPADPGFTPQQSWSKYGLTLQVNPSFLGGYVGNYTYPGMFTLTNTGVDRMTYIQLLKVTVPFEMTVWTNDTMNGTCSLSSVACSVSATLEPGASVIISASISVSQGYNGYFGVIVSTKEGVTSQGYISYNFQLITPVFQLSPSSIDATVARSNFYNYQVNVTNAGLRSATNVTARLPNEPMLSVLSFGTNASVPGQALILDSGSTAILVLQVSPSIQQNIGETRGTIVIASLETSATLTYRFVVTSTNVLNLTVMVEDEYTYFAADKPLLAGATVSLIPMFGGGTVTLVTNTSGTVVFENIREDYYTLYISADRHRPDQRTIFATGGSGSTVNVFLQRVAVTYNWIVKPVTYEDRYDITIEADFQTNVPIPVVTITPNRLDLDILEQGLMPFVNFAITNHGLIAAKGFQMNVPPPGTHPFLRFALDRELIGDIPANTTVQVVMSVIIDQSKTGGRSKRSIDDNPVTNAIKCLVFDMLAAYYYICDKERYVNLMVNFKHDSSDWNCGTGIGVTGIGGENPVGSGSWNFPSDPSDPGPRSDYNPVSVTISLNCNRVVNCFKALYNCYSAITSTVECIAEFVPTTKVLRVFKIVRRLLRAGKFVAILGSAEIIQTVVDIVQTCREVIDNVDSCVKSIVECQYNVNIRKKRSLAATKDDILPAVANRYVSVSRYFTLGMIILGDSKWFQINGSDWWESAVTPTLYESSDGGHLISLAEYSQIVQYPLPINATREMADALLMRINNSLYSWDQGVVNASNIIDYYQFTDTVSQLSDDSDIANASGFDNVAEWYLDAYNQLQAADDNSEGGVCAKVRIQILQKLVLTRSAFSAILELDNGETTQLNNIRVDIRITVYGSNQIANERFSIGKPELTGISDVDGTGFLSVNSKGSAQWLIAPYSTAAPMNDTLYNIGGTLYYSVNGENITVPLFPDTVTVKPDPRLYVAYFLEKFVYSDDALTPDVVEPSVPFSLVVLITNKGYGVASKMQITSAQPQIIDNEKGLLVTITIISTQLGNVSLSPSLTLNFGDLRPQTTTIGRWIMKSSLRGIFSNYSATFQNTNPLGDPQLSVLDSLDIYEMLHVVRVDYPTDDGLVDMLTIDQNKLDFLPDKIYRSDDGTSPFPVTIGNITSLTATSMNNLQLSLTHPFTGWAYFRVDYDSAYLQTILKIQRNDGRIVKTDYNIWINKINKKLFLHLLDYIPTPNTPFTYNIQLSNSVSQPPQFSSSVYYANVTEKTNPTIVVQVSVTNADDRVIVFRIVDNLQQPFSVGQSDGIIRTTGELNREQQDSYSIVIIAVDDSTPPLTGTSVVLVTVLGVSDNAPVFSYIPSDIYVDDRAPVGFILWNVYVKVKDNGAVRLSLSDSSGLFSLLDFDSVNTLLVTNSSLIQRDGDYSLTIKAQIQGNPSAMTEVKLIVHVVMMDSFCSRIQPTSLRIHN